MIEEYIFLDIFLDFFTKDFSLFMAYGIAIGTVLIFITYGIFKAFSLINIKK